MKRKELTKTFMRISNRNKPVWLHGLYKYPSAVMVEIFYRLRYQFIRISEYSSEADPGNNLTGFQLTQQYIIAFKTSYYLCGS